MKVKDLIFIISTLCIVINAGGQPQGIISTAGSSSIKGNTALSWVIGQPVASASSAANNSVILTQGLQEKMVVLSINENGNTSEKLHLYPNPASDILNMKFDEALPFETAVIIFDTKGNQVKRDIIETSTTEKQLNLKNFPSGIYYLRLSGSNRVNVYKVVKL
jgi:hypothetical protein